MLAGKTNLDEATCLLFPQELIEAIFSFLRPPTPGETERLSGFHPWADEETLSLRACSLTCRAFCDVAQAMLFRRVTIWRGIMHAERLLDVLRDSSPHLRWYIKELDLRVGRDEECDRWWNEDSMIEDRSIANLFPLLPNLQSLIIAGASMFCKWTSWDKPLQTAISNMLQQGTIRNFKLMHMSLVPISLFNSAHQPNTLRIFNVGFAFFQGELGEDEPEDPLIFVKSSLPNISTLHVSGLDEWGYNFNIKLWALLSAATVLSKVTHFTFDTLLDEGGGDVDTRIQSEVLGRFSPHLHSLSIRVRSGGDTWIDLSNLVHLEHFNLTTETVWLNDEAGYTSKSLVCVVPILRTITSPLRTLNLTCSIYGPDEADSGQFTAREESAWSKIVALLLELSDRRKVEVNFSLKDCSVHLRRCPPFKDVLAPLIQRGILDPPTPDDDEDSL